MEPPAMRGHLRPAVKVKMEVKEEPEYIYVDETVCRVKLEERDEEVILPKDDAEMDAEAALLALEDHLLSPLSRRLPARRGRKPKVLRVGRGGANTATATATARKILPRPAPLSVPLTLSHLQPRPQALPLPPPARTKAPQQPVMVKQTLAPPPPTNSGRTILPWPRQLSPASLTAAPLQQLQPLSPSLAPCTPSPSAQPLPLTHLQPLTPGGNNALVPLSPLSLTQLRSPPPTGCISQLGVPLSPQKVPLPPKGSRKAPATAMPHLVAGTPTPCTRGSLLPLAETSVKKTSSAPALPTTTAGGHVRKLLPRPLKQLQPSPAVCTHQTVSLQQLQTLSPATTQTTGLTLQALPVGGQPPPLSAPSQVVSLQRMRTMAMPPPQQVRPAEAPHLHPLATSTSPQRVTFQPLQQGPALSVSQAMAIQSLPATTLCQVHSLQPAVGQPQATLGSSLQTPLGLAPDASQSVPTHLPGHTPGDLQAPSQVSPGGSQSTLPQPGVTPLTEQDSLGLPVTHSLREGGTPFHLSPDIGQPALGQDMIGLRLVSRQGLATVASGLTGGATPNGAVLKVPIQPLRPSASLLKPPKRKYLRRNPWVNRKKDASVKVGSVTTYSWPLGVQEKELFPPTSAPSAQPTPSAPPTPSARKILPRLCPASLRGSQLKHKLPVTGQTPSRWLVSQVEQQEGCTAMGTSLASPTVGAFTHTLLKPRVPGCSLPHTALPASHSDTSSLAGVEQEDTDTSNTGDSFLQPISPARALAACASVPVSGDATAMPESSSTTSYTQGGEPPADSSVTDDCKMETDNQDHHRLHEKGHLGAEINGINSSTQLPGGDGDVLGEPVTAEGHVQTLGYAPDCSTKDKPTSLDISEGSASHQANLLGILEDTSQGYLNLQKTSVDNPTNAPALQSTLGDSHTTPGTSTAMELALESSRSPAVVLPSEPTTGTAEGGEKGVKDEEEVGEDSTTPPDSLLKDITLPTIMNQPFSSLHEVGTLSPSSSLPFQPPSSTSPSRSKSEETSSFAPLENTPGKEEQITPCRTEDLPSTHLSQRSDKPQELMPQRSLVDMSESVSMDSLTSPASPCSIPPVSFSIPQAVPVSSLAPTTHGSATERGDLFLSISRSSSVSGSIDVVLMEEERDIPTTLMPCDVSGEPSHSDHSSTANIAAVVSVTTTTASIISTTTVTTTTTAAAISTTTNVTATHTPLEEASLESSSQPQEQVDLSRGTVPIGCCHSEPTPSVGHDAAHPQEACRAPPLGRRRVWRKRRHRDPSSARLRTLVRVQSRTIQVLRQKLSREQRRRQALSEVLRRVRAAKGGDEGGECAEEVLAWKEEARTSITPPEPSPPVTRSRRVGLGAAPTPSATREKRKQEEQPTEALKKVASQNGSADEGLEEDGRPLPAISIPSSAAAAAGNAELQTLIQEFMTRDDVSRPDGRGSRQPLHYLPLLHKRFMADCCQPCTLETFRQHLPPQVVPRVGEDLDTCVCLTCQNPELKVESLVRRRLLPLSTRLEEVVFTPEAAFREFLAALQPLKVRCPAQLSYSEWFLEAGSGGSGPQPQKRTLTRPMGEVVALLEGELELLRPHLARAAQQYEATLRAKCEAEQSPRHAVLQAEWAPLIILHAVGAEGVPATQRAVNLQCGYLWSHADSLGYIAVSGCRDQRAAAVCASLEPLLARLVQQGVRCLTLLLDPKTDLSTVLEYARRRGGSLEVRWVFSEPGHGAGVAEAVGNSVTQLICDTVNAWGLEAVRSAEDVFGLISPNSSNLVYYYSEEDVCRSRRLVCSATTPAAKPANKLIKPKTLLSM